MADLARSGVIQIWGAAEQAAIDRCLSVPGLSAHRRQIPAPVHLSRTIEAEIIPRLLLAHLPEQHGPEACSEPTLSTTDVIDFTRLVLEQGVEALLTHVAEVRAQGHTLDAVLLELFAPTARLLGDMWSEDLCSFTDVTISLSRLQQAMRELAGNSDSDRIGMPHGRILLAPVPGDQHSFGVSMLEGFFRRDGWEVCNDGGPMSRREIVSLAGAEWLDVIALSLSSDIQYDQLRRLISALRQASRNPSVFVMVGGRYFLDHPESVGVVGADAVAFDAPDALRQASSRLSFALSRC